MEEQRPGYYKAERLVEHPAGTLLLLSYALAHRLTGDDVLWQTTRSIAKGHGLGDLGEELGKSVQVDRNTKCDDPMALFAVLELCQASKDPAYLALARRVADNILANRFHHGFFLRTSEHVNANFDALEALALLKLEAFLRGTPDAVPSYDGGLGYIHGPHDGLGRTYDAHAIWSKTRVKPDAPKTEQHE